MMIIPGSTARLSSRAWAFHSFDEAGHCLTPTAQPAFGP